MKSLILIITINSFLFAGGDLLTVTKITKYEKMDRKKANGCQGKCGKPAKLLPYRGENIPIARTFPCPLINACDHEKS